MNVPQTFFSARVDPYNIGKGGYQASDVPVVLLVAGCALATPNGDSTACWIYLLLSHLIRQHG